MTGRSGATPTSEEQTEFLAIYKDFLKRDVRTSHRRLEELLASWSMSAYWTSFSARDALLTPSPIERSYTRIKRPESVLDKIISRGRERYPDGLSVDSIRRMRDVIGARIVVYFMWDFAYIDKAIRS